MYIHPGMDYPYIRPNVWHRQTLFHKFISKIRMRPYTGIEVQGSLPLMIFPSPNNSTYLKQWWFNALPKWVKQSFSMTETVNQNKAKALIWYQVNMHHYFCLNWYELWYPIGWKDESKANHEETLINMTSYCWKLFSQWQCSFHLKAALPLAKKLQVNSCQFGLQVDSHQYSKAKPRVDFIMNRCNEYTWRLCLCHEWSVFGLRDINLFDVCVEHVARWQMDVIRKMLLCPY